MLAKIFCLCIAIALAGCATPVAMDKTTATFPAGKGFVAIRVMSNSSSVDPALGIVSRWWNLLVQDAGGKTHTLELSAAEGRRTTQVFSGFLPDGKYELLGLTLGAKSADLRNKGLTFDVKAFRITNLGSIIYQPTGNRGYAVLRSDKDDDMRTMLRGEYPMLSRSVSGAELAFDSVHIGQDGALATASPTVIGGTALTNAVGTITVGVMLAITDKLSATEAIAAWENITDPASRLGLAKSNTFSLNGIQQLPTGELLAASNLGQVLLRDPSRGWARFDVGDARELTAIYAKDRAHILVGGEEGMMYSTGDSGTTWKRVRPPAGSGLIVNISENRGEILVLSQGNGEFVLSSTRDIDQGNWTELKRLGTETRTALGTYASMQNIATIENNKYIVVTPMNAVHVLDLDTRAWRTATTAGWYRDVKAVGKQLLLASGGFRVAPQLSGDMGVTWTEIKGNCAGVYSRVVSIAFVDPQEGYMLCAANGVMVGSTSLKKTRDGGATWEYVIRETPLLASQMFAFRERIIYVDILNHIHASHDGGKTWTLDRTTNGPGAAAAAIRPGL